MRMSRCLAAVRFACAENHLRLPLSNVDYRGNYAIDNFRALRDDPEKWGWVQVSPLPKDRRAWSTSHAAGFC